MNINILFFGLLLTFIIAEEEETSLSLHSRLRGRLLGRRPHHIADDTNETKTIPVKSAKRKPGGLLRQQILSREVTPGPVSVPKVILKHYNSLLTLLSNLTGRECDRRRTDKESGKTEKVKPKERG